VDAELKETRFEKLSFAGDCFFNRGFDEALGNGDDRPDVGGVGRKAAKAGNGTPYGCVLLESFGWPGQSNADRSSILDSLLTLLLISGKTHLVRRCVRILERRLPESGHCRTVTLLDRKQASEVTMVTWYAHLYVTYQGYRRKQTA
jgi:hypothetical protein